MITKPLGRTGIPVGCIGLGAEHLQNAEEHTVLDVVSAALDYGMNYIDLFMPEPVVRSRIGKALAGRRDQAVVAGHLGAVQTQGQYERIREPEKSLVYFHDLLTRLRTDYLDILMLHYVDEDADYERVTAPGGLAELAWKLKAEGKARAVGMSTHSAGIAQRAVDDGLIDVLMLSVNPVLDALEDDANLDNLALEDGSKGSGFGVTPKRERLYLSCAREGVAIVTMKTFSGGWLFNERSPLGRAFTPVQLIHYALTRPGVVATLPGCSTVAQVEQAAAYLTACEQERDFGELARSPLWRMKQACMYCNHCLPCPVNIDIGATTRLLDMALQGAENADWSSLRTPPRSCIRCGACVARCPFGIDAMGNMQRAAALSANR